MRFVYLLVLCLPLIRCEHDEISTNCIPQPGVSCPSGNPDVDLDTVSVSSTPISPRKRVPPGANSATTRLPRRVSPHRNRGWLHPDPSPNPGPQIGRTRGPARVLTARLAVEQHRLGRGRERVSRYPKTESPHPLTVFFQRSCSPTPDTTSGWATPEVTPTPKLT